MFMKNFKTKGLIKLHDSMWVTIEPCVVNNRRLDIGTLIVGPDVVRTGLYYGDLKSQDVFVADREHSLYLDYSKVDVEIPESDMLEVRNDTGVALE